MYSTFNFQFLEKTWFPQISQRYLLPQPSCLFYNLDDHYFVITIAIKGTLDIIFCLLNVLGRFQYIPFFLKTIFIFNFSKILFKNIKDAPQPVFSLFCHPSYKTVLGAVSPIIKYIDRHSSSRDTGYSYFFDF